MRSAKKILLIILVIAVSANYAWGFFDTVKLWDSQGVPVTVAPHLQLRSASASDETGGVIIVWEDHRVEHGLPDIYGQRIDAGGLALWEDDGAPFINALDVNGLLAAQRNPTIVSDGLGGAIFTWADGRNLQDDIFAQRINANGVVQWQDQGVPICTACRTYGGCTNYKRNPQITSDGAGGAIITWDETRASNLSVWAQKVNSEGIAAWTVDGVPVASGSFHADSPKIVSDGNGGAFIAWQDGRDNYHIYAQRLDSDGIPQWTLNGVEVSPRIGLRGLQGHSMISDGSGGVIIVWVDRRTGVDANIYAQRLNSDGQIQWQPDGVEIVLRPSEQYDPQLVTDGAGGAIITWEDLGASPPGSGQTWLYAQRISGSGVPLWTVDGIPIYTNHGHNPKIVSDGVGGAFIVWNATIIVDPFFHIPSVFAQHISAEGRTFWSPNGFVVYSEPYGHYGHGPKAVSDGAGGVIIHWQDYRHTDTYWDIYAQRLADGPNKAMPWIPLLLLGD